jgi:hypothetical protein
MESRQFVRIRFLLPLLLSLPLLAQSPPRDAPVFPFSEVHAGLDGTGFTVFHGETVTPFRVRVLGTVDQGAAMTRMIVCRLEGDDLTKTGVLAAMSGSPVYVEGKFLGAVAYAWPFSKEPLCGVTPAQDLLEVKTEAQEAAARGGAGPMESLSSFLAALEGAQGGDAAEPLAADGSPRRLLDQLQDRGFTWSVAARGGFSTSGDGKTPPAPAQPPGPGGMIAVQLVSGDVQYAAYGTVSWVKGDEFLAFGHPFLNLGSVEMPVVAARVVTPVPSLQAGFKLSTPLGPVGVVTQDRKTGIFGRFGERAHTLPVEVTLQGRGPDRRYHFELIRHPLLTPALLAGALNSLWNSAEGQAGVRTILVSGLTLELLDGRSLRLKDQAFAGPTYSLDAFNYLSALLGLLSGNPYGEVRLKAIRMTLERMADNRSAAVEAAWLDRDVVAAGEPLGLSVRLQPFQKPSRVIRLSIPTVGLPAGPITLWVGGSFAVEQKMAGALAEVPHSAKDLLKRLAELPSDQCLRVALAAREPGLLLQDRRVGGLPPSMAALLSAQPTANASPPEAASLLWEDAVPADSVPDGMVELTFTVKETGHEAK